MFIEETELYNIVGGAINGNLLNYIVKGFSFIFDLGKSLGSAIRRYVDGAVCSY